MIITIHDKNKNFRDKIITFMTKKRFSCNKKSNLLNFFIRKKINIDYQCKGGFCGTCKIQLKNGKIHYTTHPIAFLFKDEILPCICYPITNIEIILL